MSPPGAPSPASAQGRTDVFGSHGIRPPQLRDELLRVKPHFDDIVEEGKHGRQGEGGHKEGDKPELDDWRERTA